jgi:tRNA threonylcarbamoyladenosine biosynthesis protein TsaE
VSDVHHQHSPGADGFPLCRKVASVEQTAELGALAADLLGGGEIILLHGSLGAGKTCFVQGLCRRLEVTDEVVSPTFTLVNTYTGRLKVHHLDFYRVEPGDDLADIGVPDILDEVWSGEAVLLVEWPEPLLGELGDGEPRLELLAVPGSGPDDRLWHLRGVPEVPAAWSALFAEKKDDPC